MPARTSYTASPGRPHRDEKASIEEALEFLPPEDLQAIAQTARNLEIDPRLLFAIIHFESGGTFDPAVRGGSPKTTATGIIQFVVPTARELGVRGGSKEDIRDALSAMTFQEQLDLTEKYFNKRGWFTRIGPESRQGADAPDWTPLDYSYATIHGGNPKANLSDDESGELTRDIGRKHVVPRYEKMKSLDVPELDVSPEERVQRYEPEEETSKVKAKAAPTGSQDEELDFLLEQHPEATPQEIAAMSDTGLTPSTVAARKALVPDPGVTEEVEEQIEEPRVSGLVDDPEMQKREGVIEGPPARPGPEAPPEPEPTRKEKRQARRAERQAPPEALVEELDQERAHGIPGIEAPEPLEDEFAEIDRVERAEVLPGEAQVIPGEPEIEQGDDPMSEDETAEALRKLHEEAEATTAQEAPRPEAPYRDPATDILLSGMRDIGPTPGPVGMQAPPIVQPQDRSIAELQEDMFTQRRRGQAMSRFGHGLEGGETTPRTEMRDALQEMAHKATKAYQKARKDRANMRRYRRGKDPKFDETGARTKGPGLFGRTKDAPGEEGAKPPVASADTVPSGQRAPAPAPAPGGGGQVGPRVGDLPERKPRTPSAPMPTHELPPALDTEERDETLGQLAGAAPVDTGVDESLGYGINRGGAAALVAKNVLARDIAGTGQRATAAAGRAVRTEGDDVAYLLRKIGQGQMGPTGRNNAIESVLPRLLKGDMNSTLQGWLDADKLMTTMGPDHPQYQQTLRYRGLLEKGRLPMVGKPGEHAMDPAEKHLLARYLAEKTAGLSPSQADKLMADDKIVKQLVSEFRSPFENWARKAGPAAVDAVKSAAMVVPKAIGRTGADVVRGFGATRKEKGQTAAIKAFKEAMQEGTEKKDARRIAGSAARKAMAKQTLAHIGRGLMALGTPGAEDAYAVMWYMVSPYMERVYAMDKSYIARIREQAILAKSMYPSGFPAFGAQPEGLTHPLMTGGPGDRDKTGRTGGRMINAYSGMIRELSALDRDHRLGVLGGLAVDKVITPDFAAQIFAQTEQ